MIKVKVNLLDNKVPKVAEQLRPRAGQLVRKAAADITASAKNRAPVDTGNLRNSITWQRAGELTAIVNVGAEYGIYVEYGTRKMRAQPYLGPAVDEVLPELRAALRELVRV
ncbi:hypothetical protein HRbin27_00056 [bacterium HR27]|nr:hypothetical protein HRbin27_00056 [bacterium HR27]